MKIIIHTDGGSRNNGKDNSIGGYGVLLEYGEHKKELYKGFIGVTNNQMELKAVIVALQTLKTTNIPIELHCDSAYVVNGINQWVAGWKKKGWKKGDGKPPENLELWKELDRLVDMQENLKILKIKGHAGHEGNERADELANIAMDEIEQI